MQRVAAGVAVPQPTRGRAVVNQPRSPTLPLASLPGRKNSLVKIMVSFWLLTFEQLETNLAAAKAKKGGATKQIKKEANKISALFFFSLIALK